MKNCYVLEYKVPYIVLEGRTKDRYQRYIWKQYAMCEEIEPLEEIIKSNKQVEWKIEKFPHGYETEI